VKEVDAEIQLAIQLNAGADFNVLTKNHNLSFLQLIVDCSSENGYKNRLFGGKIQKKHEKIAAFFGYYKKRL